MNVIFLKHFNHAYDDVAKSYFGSNGLDADGLTFEKAKEMKGKLLAKVQPSFVETQFVNYVSSWERRSDNMPAQELVLDIIFGKNGRISRGQLEVLEAKLSVTAKPIIFSEEMAATEIADFYKGFLLPSLERDLKSGNPESIYKYIEPFDEDRLSNWRTTTKEKLDLERRTIAEDVARYLSTVDPGTILDNIRFVLEDHFNKPLHMKRPSYYLGKKDIRSCDHLTQSVWLNAVSSEPDYSVQVDLSALRGHLLCEELQAPWLMPWYDVIEK